MGKDASNVHVHDRKSNGSGLAFGTRKSKYRRNVDRTSTVDYSTRPLLISGATAKLLRRAGLDLGILGADGGLRVAGR
jgi:hypothetical protein